MAQRKPYNPNTKYGRRKLREEFNYKRYHGTPEEQRSAKSSENWAAFLTILFIIVVGGVIYAVAGLDGLMNWLR